jgi:hypothetical protein
MYGAFIIIIIIISHVGGVTVSEACTKRMNFLKQYEFVICGVRKFDENWLTVAEWPSSA